ncbi:MAG: hypothetical protein AAF967_14950 [Pseudomonadota bacterium]
MRQYDLLIGRAACRGCVTLDSTQSCLTYYMMRCLCLVVLLAGCSNDPSERDLSSPAGADRVAEETLQEPITTVDTRDPLPDSQEATTQYEVGPIQFSLHEAWKEARTGTPATKLFLVRYDGTLSGENITAMIKVDSGRPVQDSFAENVASMEQRFQGKTQYLMDGKVAWIQTSSETKDLPRHIVTTLIDGRVYFIFIAADDVHVADSAFTRLRRSLKIAR